MGITIHRCSFFMLLLSAFLVTGCGTFTCEDLAKSYELEEKIGESVKSKNKAQALQFHKESVALINKMPTTGETLTCTIKGHENTYELTPQFKSMRKGISQTFKTAIDRL